MFACPSANPSNCSGICRGCYHTRFNTVEMRGFSLFATLLALFSALASATSLTYKLAPNERSCFFAWVADKNSKVSFYFAVRVRCCL